MILFRFEIKLTSNQCETFKLPAMNIQLIFMEGGKEDKINTEEAMAVNLKILIRLVDLKMGNNPTRTLNKN